MLFHPFQILSVQDASAAFLEGLGSRYCGVLCFDDAQGRLRAGDREFSIQQGSCIFAYEAGGLSFEPGKAGNTPLFIEVKITHVDLQQRLHGRALRLGCDASALRRSVQSTDGFIALEQILEFVLMDRIQSELPAGENLAGAAESVGYASPELHRFFDKLRDYLDRNMQNDFTAAQLAEAMGCSHRQLNNILQKHFSCTALEYVNDYRIQKAKLYLLSSDRNITQIAGLVGFKSVHYFSRVFKKVTGVSPQTFRSSGENKQ